MDEEPGPGSPPEDWLASLARSKAQIAAGDTVPLLPILDRLRATAERLEPGDQPNAGAIRVKRAC